MTNSGLSRDSQGDLSERRKLRLWWILLFLVPIATGPWWLTTISLAIFCFLAYRLTRREAAERESRSHLQQTSEGMAAEEDSDKVPEHPPQAGRG